MLVEWKCILSSYHSYEAFALLPLYAQTDFEVWLCLCSHLQQQLLKKFWHQGLPPLATLEHCHLASNFKSFFLLILYQILDALVCCLVPMPVLNAARPAAKET